jgi:hypothetical protein
VIRHPQDRCEQCWRAESAFPFHAADPEQPMSVHESPDRKKVLVNSLHHPPRFAQQIKTVQRRSMRFDSASMVIDLPKSSKIATVDELTDGQEMASLHHNNGPVRRMSAETIHRLDHVGLREHDHAVYERKCFPSTRRTFRWRVLALDAKMGSHGIAWMLRCSDMGIS